MPGSISEGQQPLAVQGVNNEPYLHHEYVTTSATEYQTKEVDDNDIYEEYTEKAAAPVKKPFYKNKKYWIICSIISVIVIVVVVILILFVAFPKIAQSTINHSGIDVNQAQISFNAPAGTDLSTTDANSTFYMHMVSDLTNTGPFSADIQFEKDIQVIYNDTVIGTINLPKTHTSGGHGSIDTVTPFVITNLAAFTQFSQYMMANEKFTWTLNGKAKVTALTRTASVDIKKDITLEGMNGFPQVRINSFQMPGDAPGGGIIIELGTVLTSPSPIGVQLGLIQMSIGYDGVDLGIVSADNITLQKGDNNIVLKGTMKSQANDAVAQTKISTLFSNYIAGKVSNTTATGVSAAPNGKDPITWLSDSLKTVTLHVALGAEQPLKIINSVSMGTLDLAFNKENPYSPNVAAPAVIAGFSIPFGFALNITEVSQNITLGLNSTKGFESFAVMNVPYAPASSNQQTGVLQFGINNSQIVGISGKESVFNDYTYSLTSSGNYTFLIAGNATTKVNTTIGPLVLSGINFEVPTQLHGLEFLNSSATVINSLDVVGGQANYLEMSINVTMENPSDFSISTGDVSFDMLIEGTNIGSVILKDLKLQRGSNLIAASAQFDPKSSSEGQQVLETFVMGQNNVVQIAGKNDSTAITSLANGLSQVALESTLPGLTTALIQGSALVVRTSSPTDGIVGVKVSIANPFSAGLTITKVVSSVQYNGMPVGNINQDISSNPIIIPGKTTVQSNELDMTMNVDPAAVALLLRSLAVTSQLDTRPLDALLTLGGFTIEGQENIVADSSLFANFNISSFVMDAMKSLKVDLSLASDLTIGQYANTLTFSQSGVQTATDSSVTLLIPIVGQVIVQQIVDGSVLSFESIILSSPTDSGFKVQMKGSITNTGPMAASISFPTPLSVSWEGQTLGQVSMPTIQAQSDVGATFDVSGDFSIANTEVMAKFAAYMINNNEFVWEITSSDVSVGALGFTFTKITMQKFVTLSGANGYKDAVQITAFNLPSNDPAGGITLTASTTIKNTAQVGFNFEGVSFESYYGDIDLGPLGSAGTAVFPPQGVANLNMQGRLIHQPSAEGIAAITEVFTNFLSAKNTNLTIKGVSASGPNGAVGWLSEAFKTILIENVVLPGPSSPPELIPSVDMKNLQIDFTQNPFAPPAGSTAVQAQLHSPFGFPMAITSLDMKVDANSNGHNVASLDIPTSPATTTADGIVHTGFSGIPFKVYSGAESLFTQFVAGLTLLPNVPFGLKGTVNSVAETAVGVLNLNNIGFNVNTSLAGFASFGGTTEILSVKVVEGYATYIAVELVIALNNPSNITISAGDLSFNVVMDASGSVVGYVTLPKAVINPGRNEMTANMKMTSTDLVSLATVLSNYLTGKTTPLTVQGTATSTSIVPLQYGLSQLKLKTNLQGIPPSLIVETQLNMFLNIVPYIYIKFYNPLDTPYTVIGVNSTVYFTSLSGEYLKLGTLKGNFAQKIVVPAKGTVLSSSALILAPVTASLSPFFALAGDQRKVDVTSTVTVTVGSAFNGAVVYEQKGIPVVDYGNKKQVFSMSASATASTVSGSSNTTTATIDATSTTTTITTTATTTAIETTTSTTDAAITTDAPTTTDVATTTIDPITTTTSPTVSLD